MFEIEVETILNKERGQREIEQAIEMAHRQLTSMGHRVFFEVQVASALVEGALQHFSAIRKAHMRYALDLSPSADDEKIVNKLVQRFGEAYCHSMITFS